MLLGTSLVVQWLRIYLAMQGIKANPGQGTKIPCASQLGKKKKRIRNQKTPSKQKYKTGQLHRAILPNI